MSHRDACPTRIFPLSSSLRIGLAAFGLAAAALAGPAAQAAPGPDVKIEKSCALDPSKGPTAVTCVLNVTNIGSVASVSPITITDTPNAPAGTTYTTQAGSTFPCSPTSGQATGSFSCSAPLSLNPGGNSGAGGSSGSTFITFVLPATGGTLSNCASVSQGKNAATLPDPDMSNNRSCTRISVKGTGTGTKPPDLKTDKSCEKGANGSLTCKITIMNGGPGPSPVPLMLTDAISPILPGTTYTGASGNVSCGPAGPLTGPINCTLNQSIPAGQSTTVLLSFVFKSKGTFQQCATVAQRPPEDNVSNNKACIKVAVP